MSVLIGLGHRKGVGKDTLGQILVSEHGFCRLAFADAICELGIEEAKRSVPGGQRGARHARCGETAARVPERVGRRAGPADEVLAGRDQWDAIVTNDGDLVGLAERAAVIVAMAEGAGWRAFQGVLVREGSP